MWQAEIEARRIVLVAAADRTVAFLDPSCIKETLALLAESPVIVRRTEVGSFSDHILHRHVLISIGTCVSNDELFGRGSFQSGIRAIGANEGD